MSTRNVDIEILKSKLKEIQDNAKALSENAITEYCMANNPAKIGDFVTDHVGTIQIVSININYSLSDNKFECVYYGPEYTKFLIQKKNGANRRVHQSNVKQFHESTSSSSTSDYPQRSAP